MAARVLHLLADTDTTACTAAMLADSFGRLPAWDQQVLMLAPPHRAAAFASMGIPATLRIAPPLRQPLLAGFAIRRALGHATIDPSPQLVHCWSPSALKLAAMHFRRCPRLLTVTTLLSDRQVHWLRSVLDNAPGRTHVLAISHTVKRSLVTRGVCAEAVHVLRPGIDMGRIAMGTRANLRQAWGIDDAAANGRKSSTCVLALLSDPPWSVPTDEAMLAILAATHAQLQGYFQSIRLLVHPRAPRLDRAVRMQQASDGVGPCLIDAGVEQPWRVLPGCDAVLNLGQDAGGLSLLWAMAGNRPIVSEARYAVSEIVEDRHSALLSPPGDPLALARRMERILTQERDAWQLRDTARHECYSFFSRQRYVRSLGDVYEQVAADQPIQIPDLEPTGGLRFSGRA